MAGYSPFRARGAFGAAPAPAPSPFQAGGAVAGPRDLDCPLPAGADSVQALGWSPTANFLCAGTWDSMLRVWDVQKGTDGTTAAAATYTAETNVGAPVLDTTWKEDGAHVFAATAGKLVKLWNLSTNTLTDIAGHDEPIKSIAWLADKGGLITGSWDKTIKFWDPRAGTTPSLTVPVSERVVAMDVKGRLLLVATADKGIHMFDLESPTAPFRSMLSPLKLQTRCIRAFSDQETFAIGSVEGRVAIRCVMAGQDEEREPANPDKLKNSFAFKCHRQEQMIYPVNCIDTHHVEGFQTVFSTAGSDGVFAFWDKGRRARNMEYPVAVKKQSISCTAWNANGDFFAYSTSYDWHKGAEHYNKATNVLVHTMTNEDMRGKPATGK